MRSLYNNMSRAGNVKKGILMGGINNALGIALPFLSRTVLIYKLGMEYVGLGGLFSSVLQILSLSELGFGTAISYLLYKPLAEHDVPRVNAILSFFRKIYRIIGCVILLISIVLVPFLKYLIKSDLPSDLNLYILYGIYVINTVASYFLFAYKKALLSANQRYDVEVTISSIVLIGQYVIQIVLLLLFRNYYLYVIVLPVMTVIGNVLSAALVKKIYPEYVCRGKLEKNELSEVFKNTGGAFFSKIGSTIYLSADSIVISAFLGLLILGRYNSYYYIISALITVFAVVHNSVRPVAGNIIATESSEKVWNSYKKVNYAYMWAVIVCCACCFVLLQDFVTVWTGKDNTLGFDIVVLLVIYFFSGRCTCMLVVYQEAAGIMWKGKFIPLISAAVNLTANIIMVQFIGLPGVIISSIISSVFINLPGYVYVIFKYLFMDKEYKKYYIYSLIFQVCKLVITVSISWFSLRLFVVTGWVSLVLKGILVFALSNAIMILLSFWNKDFKESFSGIKRNIRSKFIKKKD